MVAGFEPVAAAALREEAAAAARVAEEAREVAGALDRLRARISIRLDEPVARHVEEVWTSAAATESRGRLRGDAGFALWAAVVALADTVRGLETHAEALRTEASRLRIQAEDLHRESVVREVAGGAPTVSG